MLLAIHVTLTTAMLTQFARHLAVSTVVCVNWVIQAMGSTVIISRLITVPRTTVTTLPLVRPVCPVTAVTVSMAMLAMVSRFA